MRRDRIVQMCPAPPDLWAVFSYDFPDDEALPADVFRLFYRERVVAWAVRQRWDIDAFGHREDEGQEIVGVRLTSSTYERVTDMVQTVDDDEVEGFIGYFIGTQLQSEETLAQIGELAISRIRSDRARRQKRREQREAAEAAKTAMKE
jgi:hypothetical protein